MSERKFHPFDRVLVRDADDDTWRIQFYSHPYGELHACLNGVHAQCIPYEDNELLLGTTDGLEPEPELKKGDIVLVWDIENPQTKYVRVYSHAEFGGHYVIGSTAALDYWKYAEKYVPATVES